MPKTKKLLLLIDANSLIHRAFHALPELSNSKGELVNAVYGFLLIFFKALKELKPDYVAACFDAPGPTLREAKYAKYKAKRAKAPQELYDQMPRVMDFLKAF
ncbi:MAG: DNA polymerase I, partial [bacterium]|nr:DNA polymerase I [bacterium]